MAKVQLNRSSIIPPLRLVFLMWLIFSLETLLQQDFGFLGILPRTTKGLLGLFTGPLVHGNITHIISNSVPFLFLGSTVYFFYNRVASQVLMQCYFFTNILVWFFGRDFYHIGASGTVYALASFLISIGLFRRDLKSILISTIIIIFYGGMVYGLSPSNQSISWESHLMGTIVGIVTAYILRKSNKID